MLFGGVLIYIFWVSEDTKSCGQGRYDTAASTSSSRRPAPMTALLFLSCSARKRKTEHGELKAGLMSGFAALSPEPS